MKLVIKYFQNYCSCIDANHVIYIQEQVYQGAAHILAAPFIQSDGCLVAVVELYRSAACEPFRLEDEQLLDSLFHWGGVALHYADLYHSQEKQRNLHQFLLVVVKSIFQVTSRCLFLYSNAA